MPSERAPQHALAVAASVDVRRVEKGRTERFDERRPALDEIDDLVGGDACSINDDALAKVDEMWRRVGADAQTFRAKQRFGSRDTAPLPVRAGNVNRGKGAVGITECIQQRDRSLEAELEGSGRAGEQVRERLFVSSVHLTRRQRYRCRRGRQDAAHPVAAGRPDI